MSDTSVLEGQRKEFAAAFKQAHEQLKIAQGVVKNKTLETALWGWRWGRVVNDLHGSPSGGNRHSPSSLTHEQILAYCQELGLSTKIRASGAVSGTGTISKLRKIASRVATEDHLRELVAEHGSLTGIVEILRGTEAGKTARETDRERERSRRGARPATGYSSSSRLCHGPATSPSRACPVGRSAPRCA